MTNFIFRICRELSLRPSYHRAFIFSSKRYLSSNQETFRNIGIIAHVDAGKTTTTERMLYYSGVTPALGNVDRGDTVMDFLDEERDRGITISAAAITFRWRKHGQAYHFNLIDTPGHVDFAVEVERSLFVLDGAVIILDASAGVEAQTLSVTQRAKSYKLPMIGFLNKLDKSSANVEMCVKSIEQQLGLTPLLLQLPVFDMKDRSKIIGLADLLKMNLISYDFQKDPNGGLFKCGSLELNSEFGRLVQNARRNLVENAAHLDDQFAEKFLAIEDPTSNELNNDLAKTIKVFTQQGKALPIFVGSSLRNVGVQALLDGIIDHLPSPVSKRNEILALQSFHQDISFACGLIFKTVHDKSKGHLAYCRLYCGSLKRGIPIALHSQIGHDRAIRQEKVHRVYKIMADRMEEIEEAEWGGIIAISGLKQASTGMLLTTRKLEDQELETLSRVLPLKRLHIPSPVFSCSIEAESSSHQSTLETALQTLAREDPSIILKSHDEGGALVISGLGELHLEIVKHRLEKEYKLKTVFGPLQIAYIEALTQPVRKLISESVPIDGKTYSVAFDIELRPKRIEPESASAGTDSFPDVEIVKSTKDSQIEFIKPIELKAMNMGLESACRAGPIMRYPMQNSFDCRLYAYAVTPGISMAIVTATFSRAVRALLRESSPVILEPYMKIEIQVEKPFLSGILSDLASRQVIIESISHPTEQETAALNNENNARVFIRCSGPLRLLRGYATAARVLASGRISLAMELSSYQPVVNQRDLDEIRSECGFISLPTSSFKN